MKIKKKNHIDTTQTDLGLDMDTNTENIRSVSVWWCLYVLSNTYLSNTWRSIHEKVKQHWGCVEKKALLIKKACIAKYSVMHGGIE